MTMNRRELLSIGVLALVPQIRAGAAPKRDPHGRFLTDPFVLRPAWLSGPMR